MQNRKKERGGSSKVSAKDKEKLSTQAKAAKLQEILERAARRSNQEANEAAEEQKVQERLNKETNDEEEKDLLEKI